MPVFFLVIGPSFSQVDGYLKKADRCVENGNIKDAKIYYLKALAKAPENRNANLGMGLMLSELLDNYTSALPYLEKAYKTTVRDSSYDLLFALAKCYHHDGNYDKALSFYGRLKDVVDLEKETDFQKDLNKRKEDCEYARTNKNRTSDQNIYLVNCGKTINSDMPEYVPVLSGQNELIFTSKRKDSKKEELNEMDGKYFESMYMATINATHFSNVRRYTLPDKFADSKFKNQHQSVVSISQDGKKLFSFKEGKLFEIDLDQRPTANPGEVKFNHFDYYQNHAFLARDGKTLYFTSEAPGGLGGNDIYVSQKTSNGTWGTPKNLGTPINTSFNEDAPFLANDGTLYFASEGHEGFGNYDIYKSTLSEEKWSTPENLGQPINSPGHDIFLVLDSLTSVGYFSSGRNGGYGDMDIYKLIYLDKINKECPPAASAQISFSIEDADTADYKNKIKTTYPNNYKIISSTWQVDNLALISGGEVFENDYKKTGHYYVSSKIIAWCDTCLSPIVSCSIIENKLEKTIPLQLVQNETTTAVATNTLTTDKSSSAQSELLFTGILTAQQLASIGFNTNHILFDFNKSTLRRDAYEILNTNISVMKKFPQLCLHVNGYTDSRGTKAANEKVSAHRAKAVKDYLLKHGTSPDQIRVASGKGSSNLLNDCGSGKACDETEHQLNRRVEFIVMSKK